MFAPTFFGTGIDRPWWGRWFSWEVMLFVGIATLVLAAIGRRHGDPAKRPWAVTMLLIAWVLALGAHTPLFRLLADWLPGFGLFRGWGKYRTVMLLYVVLLASVGLDRLWREPLPSPRRWAVGCWLAAVVSATAALLCGPYTRTVVTAIHATGESLLPAALIGDSGFLGQAQIGMVSGLLLAAVAWFLAGAILWTARTPRQRTMLGALGMAEMLLFMWIFHASAVWDPVYDPVLRRQVAAHPESPRFHYQPNPNVLMAGGRDIWAISALLPARYAAFMAASQQLPAEESFRLGRLRQPSPMFRVLGCRYSFWPDNGTMRIVDMPDALPAVSLVTRFQVMTDRDAIFSRLADPAFDPAATVLLEEAPDPPPVPDATPGHAVIVQRSTDQIVIDTALHTPAILVLSESYSRSWRLEATPPLPSLRILPAHYAIQAIPLPAGAYRLRLIYRPPGYRLSLIVTATGWLAMVGLGIWWYRRRQLSNWMCRSTGRLS